MPISIRSLEAIIRLSTAYAKMRLSRSVNVRDAVNAFNIYMYSFYNGYKNIDENFFKDKEDELLLGRI